MTFYQEIAPSSSSRAFATTERFGLRPITSPDVVTKYGGRAMEDSILHENLHNLYYGKSGQPPLYVNRERDFSSAFPRQEHWDKLYDFYASRGLIPGFRAEEIKSMGIENAKGEAIIEGMTNMILQRQGHLTKTKANLGRPLLPALDHTEWARRTAEWLKTRYPTTGGTPQ